MAREDASCLSCVRRDRQSTGASGPELRLLPKASPAAAPDRAPGAATCSALPELERAARADRRRRPGARAAVLRRPRARRCRRARSSSEAGRDLGGARARAASSRMVILSGELEEVPAELADADARARSTRAAGRPRRRASRELELDADTGRRRADAAHGVAGPATIGDDRAAVHGVPCQRVACTPCSARPARSCITRELRGSSPRYTVNRLGTWFGFIALSIAVYDHTHSALAVAALLLAGQVAAGVRRARRSWPASRPRRAAASSAACTCSRRLATAALARRCCGTSRCPACWCWWRSTGRPRWPPARCCAPRRARASSRARPRCARAQADAGAARSESAEAASRRRARGRARGERGAQHRLRDHLHARARRSPAWSSPALGAPAALLDRRRPRSWSAARC